MTCAFAVVELARLELATPCLQITASNCWDAGQLADGRSASNRGGPL